jgi:hypothetical protein
MNVRKHFIEQELRRTLSDDVSKLLEIMARESYESNKITVHSVDTAYHLAQARAYVTVRLLLRSVIEMHPN